MPYVLCKIVLGKHPVLRISKQIYAAIKAANEGLPEIVAAEEKFDALMENFIELESTLLTLGAQHLAFVDKDLKTLLTIRNLISRRISNFLSSARLYRDAVLQHATHIIGRKDSNVIQFSRRIKAQSAHPMSYRMVEAIRNYVQHQELPISGMTFHRSREGDIESKAIAIAFAYWLDPSIDAAKIAKYRDLDADVRAALTQLGTSVNPMMMFREYIEYVGTMHQEFRKLVGNQQSQWESTLSTAIARYKRRFPKESIIALGACFRNADGMLLQPQYVSQEGQEYRRYLKLKHLTSANFSKRYVKWSA